MVLLIYSSDTEGVGERLLRAIEHVLPKRNINMCRSARELADRLRQPMLNQTAAVLLASSREELQAMIFLRDLLSDMKIILIVPDSDQATIALGHTLKPRFLCDCDSDFADVAAVLNRIISKMDQEKTLFAHKYRF